MTNGSPDIGVYLHIPYCKTLCPYCDFVKERAHGHAPDAFVDALTREIAEYTGPTHCISVFLGGGTPSLLAPQSLDHILGALRNRFAFAAPEITLEANPDDVTPELARAWRNAGINRVSLGVQSFDDRVLRYLGRRHDADTARRAIDAVSAVFDNWNMDLIFGAPPLDAWEATLAETAAIAPPHVAAYGLTYEAGTPFERKQGEAIDPDESLRLYRQLEAALAAYGHYEISNFAQAGRQSRHNLIYWRNGEYAGFGTGAYSYIGGARARNHPANDEYLRDPGGKCESLQLSLEEQRIETVIQYMRLRDGMPLADYRARFGADPREHFAAELDRLIARGLIEQTPTNLRPTPEGFYLNNEIGLELVGARFMASGNSP